MSFIRCFTLYDYSKEQFYLISGDQAFLTTQLSSMKLELLPKFSEIKQQLPQLLTFKSTLGSYLCQCDVTQRYYFILLSNPEIEEQFQTNTLEKISQHIQEVPNYNELTSEELQNQKQNSIEILIQDCENQLQRDKKGNQDSVVDYSQGGLLNSNIGNNIFNSNQNIFQSQAISRNGFNTEKDFSIETLTKIFRCFMMYDYNRQFFFMFIRRGFPIDKTWSNERNKLEKEIMKKLLDPNDPKAKPMEPPLNFKYKGDFGVYQAKYDKEAKCYFILLSRFGVKEDFQNCLLDKVYDEIQKVKNYIKLKYDSLEHKLKRNIEKLINNYEEEIIKQIDQNFIDQKLFEEKYKKLKQDSIQIYQEENKSPLLEQQNYDMKDVLNKQQEYILDDEDIVPWMTELNEKNDKQELYQSKNYLNNNNLKKMKSS